MDAGTLDFEREIVELERKIEELNRFSSGKNVDISEEIKKLKEKANQIKKEVYEKLTAWQKTQVARFMKRPRTLDYVERIFTEYVPLHGDRLFREDPAIVGGFAWLDGIPVIVIGHQKGKNTNDSIFRNFGMPHPEGYRKALRLMKMAEKFKRPIISFVDTPAAYPGIGAEERGQAEAIARNLREMAVLKVPIVVVIHGEGGSGGALGIAVGDRILMLEHAIYSVIPPEGCSAILWRESSRAKDAAEVLRLTARDLLRFGIVDKIIPEPLGGAHRNYDEAAAAIKSAVMGMLGEIHALPVKVLIEKRYEKFRKMGIYNER